MGHKHEEEAEEGGAWEIALADLMTTLMVFFLVMWLISIVDPADREAFVKGIEEGAKADKGKLDPMELDAKPPKPELKQPVTMEEVQSAMSKVNPKDIDIEETPDGIKITLRSDSFFESGRATLNDKTLEQLEQLGESLVGRNQTIKITGYTDSIPIENLQFPSNWELSAARAATVARTFIYMGLKKDLLTIEGKSDNDPVAPNNTAYGRSLNRRVIIMVNKDQGSAQGATAPAAANRAPASGYANQPAAPAARSAYPQTNYPQQQNYRQPYQGQTYNNSTYQNNYRQTTPQTYQRTYPQNYQGQTQQYNPQTQTYQQPAR